MKALNVIAVLPLLWAGVTVSESAQAQPADPPAEEAPAAEAPAAEGEPAEGEAPAEEEAPADGEAAPEEPVPDPPPAEPAPAEPAPAEAAPVPGTAGAPGTAAAAPAAPTARAKAGAGGGDPTADDGGGEEAKPDPKAGQPRVAWRGTGFTWSNNVTTSAVGVGGDVQSTSHQVYSQSYALTLNYFVVDEKSARVRVSTAPGFDREFTNSNATTKRGELLFRDLPLTGVLSVPLYRDPEAMLSTGWMFNGTVLLPTSKFSRDQGVNLRTSPRMMVMQGLPLLGKDSPLLKSVFLGVSARWDHTFADATTPVNPDLNYTRQAPSGTISSDQLSGAPLTDNTVRLGGFVFFAENIGPTTLWLSSGMSVARNYHSSFDDNNECIPVANIDTGCVTPTGVAKPQNNNTTTGFSASMSFFPTAEFGADLTYSNAAGQLGADGTRRGVFYSPGALFSASLIISIDGIYERVTGPKRTAPFVLFGKNDKTKKSKTKGSPAPAREVSQRRVF